MSAHENDIRAWLRVSNNDLSCARLLVEGGEEGLCEGVLEHGGQRGLTEVSVRPGETFGAYGFNRFETWRLHALKTGHALFEVTGSQSSCIGIWPFGPPVHRFRYWALVCPHGVLDSTEEEP